MEKTAIKDLFSKIKAKNPLVHHLTNMVTMNDCANVTLAIGGSPVMASTPEEAADIAGLADALVINFGTFEQIKYEAMLLAGQAANEKGIPVVFDPVGVGAARFRTEHAFDFLQRVNVSIIRGNASEISALMGENRVTRGVDAAGNHLTNPELAVRAAKQLKAIAVISGETDLISDGSQTVKINNGDIRLTRITGTGCMTTSLIASFAGITDDSFAAAVAGMSVMSLAGERAVQSLQKNEGIGTYRIKLMDEIFLMTGEIWEEGVRFG